MYDESILESLDGSEIELLLESISDNYGFYDKFKGGAPIKFDLHPKSSEVRIHMFAKIKDECKWTWCNSVLHGQDKFYQTYLQIVRSRNLNDLI